MSTGQGSGRTNPERIAEIRARLERGEKIYVFARELGITPQRVMAICDANGIPRPRRRGKVKTKRPHSTWRGQPRTDVAPATLDTIRRAASRLEECKLYWASRDPRAAGVA